MIPSDFIVNRSNAPAWNGVSGTLQRPVQFNAKARFACPYSRIRRIIAGLEISSACVHPAGSLFPWHGTLERPGSAFHAGASERSSFNDLFSAPPNLWMRPNASVLTVFEKRNLM